MANDGLSAQSERPCMTDNDWLAYRIFKRFLEVSRDGFVIVNDKGDIIELNKAYAETLGISREEGLTRHILEVIQETKLIGMLATGATEVDVLDVHQEGALKGVILVSTMSAVQEAGKGVAAFAHVRFIDQTTEIANNFQRVAKERAYYKEEYERLVGESFSFDWIIGSSDAMYSVKRKALQSASLEFTVLLQGETGTGKEIFARAIHNASPRAGNPFIRVNCAAIPTELVESELFGYEEGAFSGAKKGGKPGKIEMANSGTLFLDEIGDMPMPMQAKLLRVLQERELERLGSNKVKPVNVRVIAATNQDLETLIAENRFRADLYYRLNVISITIPPLRQRPGDITELAQKYLSDMNVQSGTSKRFHPTVLRILEAYPWPGNVRELRNAVWHAYSFTEYREIMPNSLPQNIMPQIAMKGRRTTNKQGLKALVRKYEADIIADAVLKCEGNHEMAARLLCVHKATLYKKLKALKGR